MKNERSRCSNVELLFDWLYGLMHSSLRQTLCEHSTQTSQNHVPDLIRTLVQKNESRFSNCSRTLRKRPVIGRAKCKQRTRYQLGSTKSSGLALAVHRTVCSTEHICNACMFSLSTTTCKRTQIEKTLYSEEQASPAYK